MNLYGAAKNKFKGAANFKGAAMKTKTYLMEGSNSLRSTFHKSYKVMGKNKGLKVCVIGTFVSFMFLTNEREKLERKMVIDELVALNEGRIMLEEWTIKQGDKKASVQTQTQS